LGLLSWLISRCGGWTAGARRHRRPRRRPRARAAALTADRHGQVVAERDELMTVDSGRQPPPPPAPPPPSSRASLPASASHLPRVPGRAPQPRTASVNDAAGPLMLLVRHQQAAVVVRAGERVAVGTGSLSGAACCRDRLACCGHDDIRGQGRPRAFAQAGESHYAIAGVSRRDNRCRAPAKRSAEGRGRPCFRAFPWLAAET
jgi:hypothetical protein